MIALSLPFRLGRLVLGRDRGVAALRAGQMFDTHVWIDVLDHDGNLKEHRDLGSGLVTTAGVNYMAADFLAASANRINAFKYHALGIGTTAAAIANTTLENVTGCPARVAGTDTNPSANVYQSVATIAAGATLAITEWGLFSASSGGTLWDRRVFAAINTVNGDSVQVTYQLTCTAGG